MHFRHNICCLYNQERKLLSWCCLFATKQLICDIQMQNFQQNCLGVFQNKGKLYAREYIYNGEKFYRMQTTEKTLRMLIIT